MMIAESNMYLITTEGSGARAGKGASRGSGDERAAEGGGGALIEKRERGDRGGEGGIRGSIDAAGEHKGNGESDASREALDVSGVEGVGGKGHHLQQQERHDDVPQVEVRLTHDERRHAQLGELGCMHADSPRDIGRPAASPGS